MSDGWGWQASLSIDFTHFTTPRFNCMGILVSDEFILTTGHCLGFGVEVRIPPQNILVSLGSYVYGFYDNDNNIHAKEIIYHPTLDLALVRLLERAPLSNRIQPVCLPQGKHDVDLSEAKEILATTWSPDHVLVEDVILSFETKISRVTYQRFAITLCICNNFRFVLVFQILF